MGFRELFQMPAGDDDDLAPPPPSDDPEATDPQIRLVDPDAPTVIPHDADQRRRSYENLRRHDRVVARFQVEIVADGQRFTGEVHNISEGGVFVSASSFAPVDAVVDVVLKIPPEALQVQADVRWVRDRRYSDEAPTGLGLAFRGLSRETANKICAFVLMQRAQDL